MSQGQVPQSNDGQQRARRFVGKLIEKFEIQVRENAYSALTPKERFALERQPKESPKPPEPESPKDVASNASDAKAAYRELVKPFVQRFTAAAKVDPQPFDDERRQEIQEKKVALAKHLKEVEAQAQAPEGMESAKAHLEQANHVATELLSRRYQLDANGKPQESKPLTPQLEAGERREFAGREMLARYQSEDRSHYENRAKQKETADYIDQEGHLVDQKGNPLNTKATGKDLYTSRLDTGSSHSFSEADAHHSYATEGTAAIGAGTREVKRGIVRKITGDSGHYAPTAANIHEYITGLAEQGVKMIDDESLFMPDPDDPDQHVPVPEHIAYAWSRVITYEQERADRQKRGAPLEKYSPEIAQIKQRIADLGVWPGYKDAEVDAVREGMLASDEEVAEALASASDSLPILERTEQKEQAVVALLRKRLGDTIYSSYGRAPVDLDAREALLQLNHLRTKSKLAHLPSLADVTTSDVNQLIGAFLRLQVDIGPDGKSKARVLTTAEQFLQTGGNAQAIDAKEAVQQELTQAGPKLVDQESDDRVAKLYQDLGGDEQLARAFGVCEPGGIDVNLKYAWLVKGRIADDVMLYQVLLKRFGASFPDPGLLLNSPYQVKRQLLASKEVPPGLVEKLEQNENDAKLLAYNYSEFNANYSLPSDEELPVIARVLGIPLEEFRAATKRDWSSNLAAVLLSFKISPADFERKLAAAKRQVSEAAKAQALNPTPPDFGRSTSKPASDDQSDNSSDNSSDEAVVDETPIGDSQSPVELFLPSLAMVNSFELESKRLAEVARRLKMPLHELLAKLRAPSDLTYAEVAEDLGMSVEQLLAAIDVVPNDQLESPSDDVAVENETGDSQPLAKLSLSSLDMANMIELTSKQIAEVARRLKMPLHEFLAKLRAPSDLTYAEVAKDLGMSVEQLLAAINVVPDDQRESASDEVAVDNETGDSQPLAKLSLSSLDMANMIELTSKQLAEVARRLKMPLHEMLAKLRAPSDLTYAEVAEDLGMSVEQLLAAIDLAPEAPPPEIATPRTILISSSSLSSSISSSSLEEPVTNAPQPTGPEQLDLRKVKKSTKDDPNAKPYEEAGGDDALLESLLQIWKQRNVAALARLRELEGARNELKARLTREAADPQVIDAELKKLDEQQAGERKPLKSKLKDSRPLLANLDSIELPRKVALLQSGDPQAIETLLGEIGRANAEQRAQRKANKQANK